MFASFIYSCFCRCACSCSCCCSSSSFVGVVVVVVVIAVVVAAVDFVADALFVLSVVFFSVLTCLACPRFIGPPLQVSGAVTRLTVYRALTSEFADSEIFLKNHPKILLKSAGCRGAVCPGGVLLTEVEASPLQVI